VFLNLVLWSLGFVSDFVLRIPNLSKIDPETISMISRDYLRE